ncbi:efflux RND transporter periplasmic adaptor subunit [Altererythrobacter sp. MTPC7]|uniref:efflux RND transporter periplasmic adaptor subunit n=1 Tax=Altererythrobacter sp. MTPC7 TaxID=3056567 RepID=UPI0036F437CE
MKNYQMKRPRLLLALAAAGMLAACSSNEEPKTEPRPVDWLEVGGSGQNEASPNVVPATVRARETTQVAFEVPGRLATVRYEIGQSFSRGAPLATIESNEYRLRVAEAGAALAESWARLSQARQDLTRQEELFAEEATSEAALERARAQAGSLQEISKANAARVGIARESLSDSTLRAPFAGRVARRLLEQGAQVQPGQPVLEIDSMGIEVSFNVSRDLREGVAAGSQITVILDRDGERIEVPGSITEISSRAAGIGAFEVLASVPSMDGALLPGMAVDVRIEDAPEADTKENAARVIIPITAFKPTAENRGEVYIVDPETGKVSARAITLGPASGDQIVVKSGLSKGDIIMRRGLAFVKPDETVALIGSGAKRYAQ